MKNLIYFFLLFSSVVFAQNYNYAIGNSKKIILPTVPAVNNQPEEVAYFSAYVLPLAQKANIQTALNTYGAIRLEKGDYSGVNITMSSNQKIYGAPSFQSRISNITIAAGSTGVVLEDLFPLDKTITLQAGGVISGCIFKSIKWCTLSGTNVMFENNTLINYLGNISLNCSASGYFRNNKIIRHQSGSSNSLILKGNSTTPSYGNTNLWTNFLTPHGNTTELDNLQSQTFVGIDVESWNYTNEGTRAAIYARNVTNLKIADLNGGTSSAVKTPAFDIDALNLTMLNRELARSDDILALRTNMFAINGNGTYTRQSGTKTGFDLVGNFSFSRHIKYENVEQTATIVNATAISNITNAILQTEKTPWSRPTWNTIPDPLGVNWATERIGKPDSRAYIQNLINTNGIAQLPEGIFYISSTLTLAANGSKGIIGQGTGKTVICGLTDNFPLMSITPSGGDGNVILGYLTLQGGNTGFYVSTDYGSINLAYQYMKFVVFRNQNYAIHLKRTGGFDNNFLENLAFLNCNIGFYQEPTPGDFGEQNSAYVDKTMFYKNQFLNCNKGISMLATRADNLNAWVDCKFNVGSISLDLGNQNGAIVANCDFSNYTGNHVINSNKISIYNARFFSNNPALSIFKTVNTNIEGCEFLDNERLFVPILSNTPNHHISNSVVTGDVEVIVPVGQGYGLASAIYSNNNLIANSSLSKLLVNVKNGVPTTIINSTPDPYPQFLVTQ